MRSPSVSFVTALAVLLVTAAPLAAQEAKSLSLSAAAISAATTDGLAEVPAAPTDDRLVVRERRPGALVPLYVSFSALQVLDLHSTAGALGRGAVEANPVVKPFAGNQFGMIAVKAAGTAGVILASEQMWKKNKAAAVVFMLGSNAAMSWVVQHNYRIAQ
jgi:uncharacterized protein DUF5658